MAWTLLHNAVEKSFADWGLVNLMRRRRSQNPDEVRFVQDAAAFDGAPLFSEGDTVTIKKDTVQWFVGRVAQVPRAATGEAESLSYLVEGPWYYLDNLPYQQQWNIITDPADPENSISGGYRSHYILNQGFNGSRITTGAQIADAIDYCIAQGTPTPPIQKGTITPALTVPFSEDRDLTCGEVIRRMLRWTPDAATRFDYATSPPTLHANRRSQLPATVIDAAVLDLSACVIRDRKDIHVPGVVLKFERVHSENGTQWSTIEKRVAPDNGLTPGTAAYDTLADDTARKFGVLLATMDLRGSQTTVFESTIKVNYLFPIEGPEWWWEQKIPGLLETITEDITPITRSGVNDYQLEVVEGEIADWMGINYEEEDVHAFATVTQASSGTKDVRQKVNLNAKIISTDYPAGTHTIKKAFTVPGEDLPEGLALEIYNALNTLHSEGQIVIEEDEVTTAIAPGNLLNISGGKAEWASMRALVQEVTEDVDNGRTTVGFGPPSHLSLTDYMELFRLNRQRVMMTPPDERTTAKSAKGGTLSLSNKRPPQVASAGGGWTEFMEISHVDHPLIWTKINNQGVSLNNGEVGTAKRGELNLGHMLIVDDSTGEYVEMSLTNGVINLVTDNGSVSIAKSALGGKALSVITVADWGDDTKRRKILASDAYIP